MMESLDPRVNRIIDKFGKPAIPKSELDQLQTFEVFVRKSDKRPVEHVGVVHSGDEELAFVFAKEQFSRRNTCLEMWIARTSNTYVTVFSEGEESIYDSIPKIKGDEKEEYYIFHLLKRGKQHVFVGAVLANSVEHALSVAKENFGNSKVYNIWVIRSADIQKYDDNRLWETLPDKGFREAFSYRAGDKLKNFLKERKQ